MKLFCKMFKVKPLNILRRVLPLLSLLAVVAVLGSPPVYADAKSDAAKQAYVKSLRETQQHLRDVEKKLSDIQKETEASNPELQKREEDFRKMLMSAMSTKDYNADEEMKRLNELQAELTKKDIKPADKRKLFREFLQRKSRFQQAQGRAFSQPNIKKAQEALQAGMVDAMKKRHPETDQLLKELEKTQKEFAQKEANAPR